MTALSLYILVTSIYAHPWSTMQSHKMTEDIRTNEVTFELLNKFSFQNKAMQYLGTCNKGNQHLLTLYQRGLLQDSHSDHIFAKSLKARDELTSMQFKMDGQIPQHVTMLDQAFLDKYCQLKRNQQIYANGYAIAYLCNGKFIQAIIVTEVIE
ncbi:hypothetical protein B9T33_00695 [Acinetobacter sp. ANC 5054]|uniref:hypothetical protein n=1 Tax=Acinetobacter sp. ANC 5054 TaxID=1977877 RepID=UPI000A35AE21|nr:hypothetical protein [Acinetobacter sp. ANC 5054]OTG84348.1 hypothetical protein B9T33_00695 [Acinetobacter sp. ANC 5054]